MHYSLWEEHALNMICISLKFLHTLPWNRLLTQYQIEVLVF